MLKPNIDRLLVKKVKSELLQDENILLPGQLKVGENLFAGEVVDPGDSGLRIGQLVFYSEFSAARIIDMGRVFRGECTIDEVIKEDNLIYVIAKDDVMATDDYDFGTISKAADKGSSEAQA
jgi:co-chaperonin GroES (HSP10)